MLKRDKMAVPTDERKVAQWIIDHGFYAFGYDYLSEKWVGMENTVYETNHQKEQDDV